MAITAFPLDAVGGEPEYTGRMLRDTFAALLGPAPAGRPLGAISGVRPGTPATTVTVAAMVWSVAPHAGVLDVQASPEAGAYLYAVLSAETGSVGAAHATYTRWDGIYVTLEDPAEGDGSSSPAATVTYVAGTPAASPAMPTAPARSLLLARIVVPQTGGGSPSVVWLAPQTGSSTVALTIVAGSPLYSPAATKHADGWVDVEGGVAQSGSPAIANMTWTTVANLPAGFRPAKYQAYSASVAAAGGGGFGARVQLNGDIEVYFSATTGAALPLTGIRFRAAS